MLREIKDTSQKRGEPKRRWFSGADMDLFVWLDDNDEVVGYQLTYDKPNAEKALTWSRGKGYSHLGVDDGSRPGKHPASPLLVEDGLINIASIVAKLKKNSGDLDPAIARFIVSGIEWHFESSLAVSLLADMVRKIEQDFDQDAPMAIDLIEDYSAGGEGKVSNRLLRGIIFLAQGDLDKLEHAIELAQTDFRDVLAQAEYDCGETQIYDFTRTFDDLNLLNGKT